MCYLKTTVIAGVLGKIKKETERFLNIPENPSL